MSINCQAVFPRKKIPIIEKSFETIYQELLVLTQKIVKKPIMKKLFENPYQLSADEVNQVDRVVAYYASLFCNDTDKLPSGVYKRFLATTNDGLVWVDVSTYVPALGLLNFTTLRLNLSSNVYQLTQPQSSPLFSDFFKEPRSVVSNPNLVSLTNIQEKLEFAPAQTVVYKIGLTQKPYSPQDRIDTNDPPPFGGEGVSYKIENNHQTRIEIQQAFLSGCGYSSRYSETNFKFNYYVALRISSEKYLGYSIVFRLSYFIE